MDGLGHISGVQVVVVWVRVFHVALLDLVQKTVQTVGRDLSDKWQMVSGYQPANITSEPNQRAYLELMHQSVTVQKFGT